MWMAQTIAEAFADCSHDADDMAEDAAHDLGFGLVWLLKLAKRIQRRFDNDLPRDAVSIRLAILADKAFRKRFKTDGQDLRVPGTIEESNELNRSKSRWPGLPVIESLDQLAELLQIERARLDWLVRCKGNYRQQWIRKRSSGLRLVEAPKPMLKSIQAKILRMILNRVSPHNCSHGFRTGRSVVSYTSPHVKQDCVLKFDLRDFFPTITFSRVVGLYKALGFQTGIARALGGLCTTGCPASQINRLGESCDPVQLQALKRLYLPAHLPQGSPCSPMLANHCTYRLDCRLAGFASVHGARYTRYADDLLFSGDHHLAKKYDWFASVVGAIVLEEGFRLNYRKSRLMRSSTRQQSAGVILNRRTNILRGDYDRLKATLYNCVRHGTASQNREGHSDFRSHLVGKVGWVTQLNPARGAKLRMLLDQIDWS